MNESYRFPVDVFLFEDRLVLALDCPGMTPKVELLPDDQVLVTAYRQEGSNWLYGSRTHGLFAREFDCGGYDTGKMTAELDNGVLTLTVPKRPEPVPVLVEVVRVDKPLPAMVAEQVAKSMAAEGMN